ncbi:MAG: Rid family detoxifying hydrolase [Candidatus Omnitrophica bacterium]|nr:Rid family detoxifying hydrolase [Candidatus Omnitrophota bacterium]
MNKTIILSTNAPQPVGPYSQAVMSGQFIFLAGQIPLTKEGKKIDGGITEQTEQVITNIIAVLAAGGTTLERVVKVTVFLQDMNDFKAMNEVYAKYFKPGYAPARSTVQVARLPMDSLVEIEAIAEIS